MCVMCCAGFCIQPKSLTGQPRVFWGFMFFSFFLASGLDSWLPFQPPALPRTAGPDSGTRLPVASSRLVRHASCEFYDAFDSRRISIAGRDA